MVLGGRFFTSEDEFGTVQYISRILTLLSSTTEREKQELCYDMSLINEPLYLPSVTPLQHNDTSKREASSNNDALFSRLSVLIFQ
ncbi:hypothetical protein TNCV_4872491 [Trichonephila clavipes]|nr:hypothetical protein TNCV_4872491 [Trichonephila clavipes]